MAERFAAGFSLGKALQSVSGTRRDRVRTLLEEAGLTGDATTVAVMRAIEGANRRTTNVEPVWTMPGNRAEYGRLTSSVADLVLSARTSVTCTTYNFEETSSLWEGLREVSTRPGVAVTVYVDAKACAKRTPQAIAAQLPGARVLASKSLNGYYVRSHAKIVCVDHRFLVVSSANLSASGELYNVELGLRVDDPALSQLIEQQLIDVEQDLYGVVSK
jgi:phosphatidylserine/phosphatidylglycerophosphate/cardiolipin synthase-like enzyme